MTRVFSDGKRHRFLGNAPSGEFVSLLKPWTPDTWDDCWVSKGRAIVLRPDYPRARRRGHALRAHIVWWLTTGEAPPEDKHLHHKNHDKLDDRFENLELMGVAEHMAHHRHHAGRVELPCAKCGTPVSRERNRVRYNRVFCSHACYAAFPKSAETRGRHRQAHLGERHWAAKLNAEAVRLIRSSTESAEALAERYGVKLVTINAARRGYNWSHV